MASDKDIRFGIGLLGDLIGGIATGSGTGSWEQGVLTGVSSITSRTDAYLGGSGAPSGLVNNDPANAEPSRMGQSVKQTGILFYGLIAAGIVAGALIIAKLFKIF